MIPKVFKFNSKDELKRLEDAKIIEPVSICDWASPIVLIPKTDGSVRMCGDFKVTINPCMKVDRYPIPNIDELLSRLNGGEKFTKLDFSDAYLQVELDDESKPLTTISTPFGFYQYLRMPFGISNAPAIFQKISDQIVAGIPYCAAYLDDIIISGKDSAEHQQNLLTVLHRVQEFGFKCKLSKCSFFQDEVNYLGYIINKHGKRANSERVSAITNLAIPKSLKEVESFIGKINYYSKFISNFSAVCTPLNNLRKKGVKFNWDIMELPLLSHTVFLMEKNVRLHILQRHCHQLKRTILP